MKEYNIEDETYKQYLLGCIESCSFISSSDAVVFCFYFYKNRWNIQCSEPTMEFIFKSILYTTYRTKLRTEYKADITDNFLFTLDINLSYRFIMSPSERSIWFDKCFLGNMCITNNSTILPCLPLSGKTFKIDESFETIDEVKQFVTKMNPSEQKGLYVYTPFHICFMIKNPYYEPYQQIYSISKVDGMEVAYLRLSDSDRIWFRFFHPNSFELYDYFMTYTFVLYIMRFLYGMKLYADEIILNDIHTKCEGKLITMKHIEYYFSIHIDLFTQLFWFFSLTFIILSIYLLCCTKKTNIFYLQIGSGCGMFITSKIGRNFLGFN
jgi:hypothetical protein